MKFNPATVAQISAFFAEKEGGSISVLKLMKLLYLADRLSIEAYEEPISWDNYVSMDQGPVLSKTLDYINGSYPPSESESWDQWIKDRDGYMVGLARPISNRRDLSHLSDADIDILKATWEKFGHMDKWQIRDYTHHHCPEWTDPKGSSIPFDYEDVLRGVGKSSKEVRDMYHRIREQREIDHFLS